MSILRYTIPNSFTALSLLLGLGSIVTGQLGDLELAAWMIVWGGLLDVLDGLAARLLKATSSFGAEFDSMADLITFGVAPGMLVLQAGMKLGGVQVGTGTFWILLVAVGVYALCGAMRLARFNLTSDMPGSEWFVGIPITAVGGGLIAPAIILLARYHDEITFSMPLHAYLPLMMFAFGLAMISTIRFPKIRRRNHKLLDTFQAINFAASYYFGITRTWPEYLFFMAVFLLIVGIIAGRISKKRESQLVAADAGD